VPALQGEPTRAAIAVTGYTCIESGDVRLLRPQADSPLADLILAVAQRRDRRICAHPAPARRSEARAVPRTGDSVSRCGRRRTCACRVGTHPRGLAYVGGARRRGVRRVGGRRRAARTRAAGVGVLPPARHRMKRHPEIGRPGWPNVKRMVRCIHIVTAVDHDAALHPGKPDAVTTAHLRTCGTPPCACDWASTSMRCRWCWRGSTPWCPPCAWARPAGSWAAKCGGGCRKRGTRSHAAAAGGLIVAVTAATPSRADDWARRARSTHSGYRDSHGRPLGRQSPKNEEPGSTSVVRAQHELAL
jgi:hypothetical protein